MSQQIKCTKKSNIYFLRPKKKKSKDHISEDMLLTYDKCLTLGMEPVWISERDSNKMKFTRNDILVVEKYEELSDNTLKTSKCCIVNPELFPLISNITLGRTSPVHSNVMQDLCICISSRLCLEDKRYIQVLVSQMSGNFTTKLNDKVTHLVILSILSVEYEKAIRMKIQIVTKEWVKAIWEANKGDYVEPNDKRFDKYKVSIFYNLVITATNIKRCEKEEIARLIKDNGGMYLNDLDIKKVNIVLAPENSEVSQKLKYAEEANIICLTLNWLYESIKAGHALPFKHYIYQTEQKEQYSSRRSNVSTVTTILDNLTFIEAEAAGPFLYGCVIYLAGFTSDQKDKLNLILTVGYAMPFDYVCDMVTHVIVGDEDRAASELKLLKPGALCPHILKLEWLVESIRLKQPAPVEYFLYEQENSTLKKDLQLMQERMSEEGKESSNLGQQELHNAIVSTTDEPYTPVSTQLSESPEEYFIPPEANNIDINDRLFEGLTFVVSDLCDMYNDVVKDIIAMNGKVVQDMLVTSPDYGIVPKFGMTLNCTAKEIVTDLFIEDCIDQGRIVKVMYYHRPISVTKIALVGCVLTISTYVGVERSYLVTLAMELGATKQNIFACETIIEEGIYKNTHLICPMPEGKKYDLAVRCKIPVVTAEWLKACAAQSTWVDETPFLVKSLGPERPMELDTSLLQTNTNKIVFSTEPVATTSRSCNIIVPKEYLLNLQVQNNILKNMLSNELSLPMNTTFKPPETQCSQVFRSIPSLGTERSWLEGINYSLNLIKEKPPLEKPFNRVISMLKKNCQKVNEKLPENHDAAAKDGFN
ncbi:DNA topoisomerase 2-binding protein 1-like isoform X2 [Bombus affinis]|uniref:DNA topoisomerase 2-binding protein 1-like isoform X2 n=1 Tax=Bombus affinis TaxID=309941 RepID=UPI0021B7C198|nr:DNA topoisomerase 2-binding protein 1-like isoform X2 [Bombus affinis]